LCDAASYAVLSAQNEALACRRHLLAKFSPSDWIGYLR